MVPTMPDQVTGISVLQPTWVPGVYRLWVEETKATGQSCQSWIFIAEKGTPNIPAKFPGYSDGCNSLWWFVRNGKQLDCSPSINHVSWGFHNNGAWSTEYVEMVKPCKPYDPDVNVPWDEEGSSIHYNLTRCIKEPPARLVLIMELQQAGAIKPQGV